MQKVNQPSFTSTSQILIIHTNVSKKTFARLNFNLRQLLYSLIWTVREQVNMHSSRVDFFYGSVCFHCNTCGDNPPSVQKCGIWSWSVASAIANQVDIFRSLFVCFVFFAENSFFFFIDTDYWIWTGKHCPGEHKDKKGITLRYQILTTLERIFAQNEHSGFCPCQRIKKLSFNCHHKQWDW